MITRSFALAQPQTGRIVGLVQPDLSDVNTTGIELDKSRGNRGERLWSKSSLIPAV